MAARARKLIFQRITLWRLALATFVFGLLAAAFSTPDIPKPTAATVFPTGVLRIGVDASHPPFAVATADDLFGLEIELGRALGDYLNVPVQFVNISYDGLYDAVSSDPAVVDVLISQVFINPIRMGDVRYTQPYFDAGLVLVSPAEAPLDGMEALPGRSVAFELGSSADNESRIWSRRVDAFTTLPYERPAFALDAVRLGEADAALVDAISARLYLRDHPEWSAHTAAARSNFYAIVVDHEDIRMYAVIDEAIGALLANGAVAQIIDRWL
jgi:polar amino acid transport system substrate-binding protein